MSKELEYLADLYSHTKCNYDDLDCKNIVQTSYNKLKQALIELNDLKMTKLPSCKIALEDCKNYSKPPTAEEVCEVIKKHYVGLLPHLKTQKVIYENNMFIHYLNDNEKFGTWVVLKHKKTKRIIFEQMLPPHLITLIGRFYEGLEND